MSNSTPTRHCGVLLLLALLATSEAFSPSVQSNQIIRYSASKRGDSTLKPEDDIARLQRKAREVLAKSKAKLEEGAPTASTSNETVDGVLPFFASRQVSPARRDQVIKDRNEATGLVTADGEKMAALSESEAWERRSLRDVFQEDTKDSSGSDALAQQDVAMQIFNLRKQLQDEDYAKIFDKRNRFIGEDT